MILLGVFALIFIWNNKENESLGSGKEEYNAGGTINGDKGYISSAQIIQTKTGTGPWDANDEPGNDSSEDNNIVRSFDQVTWTVDLTMALKSGITESNLTGGIINVEASIPSNCANVVTWDLESMGWLEGSGKVSSDGLVLTGKYVMSTTDNTIPGKQTLVLVLKVEGAQNQTKIKPEFKFWLEGNEDEEKYTINNVQDVKVSATPRYNVELKRNKRLAKEITLEENETSQNGKLYGYSLVYQLYNNTNNQKGIKGIEYPKDEINLNIQLKLEKIAFDNPNQVQDITDSSTPILYNYRMNEYNLSATTVNGYIPNRNMAVTRHAAHQTDAPGAFGGGEYNCYNSGTVNMEQDGDIIRTKLTGYEFNGEFPDKYVYQEQDKISTIRYTENIGCFSVVYFQIFVPYTDESSEAGFNYYLTVEDKELEIYSISGTKMEEQIITTDDLSKVQNVIYGDGAYTEYHWLQDEELNELYSHYNQGDSRAQIGQKIFNRLDITCGDNNEQKDDIYDINALMKFDGVAFNITNINGSSYVVTNKATDTLFTSDMKFKMLYAAKKDGTNWISEEEMKDAEEEELLFFVNEEALKQQLGENAICIGVLFESISGICSASSGVRLQLALEVTENAQIGNVYQFISVSNLYKKDNKLNRSTQTRENPNAQFPNADVTMKWNYIKTAYDENGNIISGTHNGGYKYGQSLLIVGGKLSVIHSVEDKSTTGNEKVNYDIGRNENTVTFGIKPQLQTTFTTGSPMSNVTVTLEETLPTNASGIMGEELVTVNYYYIKKAVLEVNYIDIYTNKQLTDQIVDNTKHEGDEYTTEQKEFENYDLVEVPSNASGTMKVETDEEGNITNNRTVVTYYYTQRAVVEEHHIDSLTGKDIEEPAIHNGHVGDEYDIHSKEFLSYQLIEEDEEGNSMLPENSKGTMTAEKIVVTYYYNQPAKVIVYYVEKATGKELEELNEETGEMQSSQVTIEGFNQEEYTTKAKEFEYYTLIESPEEPNGTMKVEIVKDEEGKDIVNNTIDVYYYYEAKTFNIGVEKEITGIIVNGERRAPTNGKLEKVEIYRKSTESTSVQVEYKIKVSNTGEVSGNATIEENIPEGMSLANNDGTWEEQEGVLRKIIPEINPGETKEYTVVLNWNTAETNMGEKDNVINIVDTQNVPGFVDNNDKDNTSNANVIIAVETGELPIGLILVLVALVGLETVTLRYAVVLTKRQKKNK